MMTKKDFQRIALAIYGLKPKNSTPGYWLDTCAAFVTIGVESNPRFEPARFMQACLSGKDSNSARVREQYVLEEKELHS